MSPELEAILKSWLETATQPKSFYDLLGLPLLSPQTDELTELLMQAGELFYDYQNNHRDRTIRQRATLFSRQVAEARRVLRDPAQLKAYHQDLIVRLWEENWDRFLRQFDEPRQQEVAEFCQSEGWISETLAGMVEDSVVEFAEASETIHAANLDPTLSAAFEEESHEPLPDPVRGSFNSQLARLTQETWAQSLGKPVVWENSLKMKLGIIPPGEFFMGPSQKENASESNPFQVTLTKPFWLGVCPVTQSQWRDVMASAPWEGENFVKLGPDYPATFVSFEAAEKFCQVLTEQEHQQGVLEKDWEYTLPTEAQWEFACRAGTVTRYSFGDEEDLLEEYAWFRENAWAAGDGHPYPVGQKLANPFGLQDMHGNIWEWCQDWFRPALTGGNNPVYIVNTGLRAIRGGSWAYIAKMCSSTYRLGKKPETQNSNQGFRIAAVPKPQEA